MITCVIIGQELLVHLTLEKLCSTAVNQIIIATNKPCEKWIQNQYDGDAVFYLNKEFSNQNKALNFALKYILYGRVLILQAGSIPTTSSIDFHIQGEKNQVICGSLTYLYDFETNFQDVLSYEKIYRVPDSRSEKNNYDNNWMFFRNNNVSLDLEAILRVKGFDENFCVDGITENADIGYELYKLGFQLVFCEDAKIETCSCLTEEQVSEPLDISNLYIWFTDVCNYNCKMCKIGQKAYSAKLYKEPSYEEILEIIEVAKNNNIKKIELYGGEVLSRKDLVDVIKHCRENGMEVGFVTNGSLITTDISKKFYSLGVKDIPISLDAPTEKLNDFIRGKSAWTKTWQGIENLKKHNNTFSIFYVISNYNYKYMSDMIKLAKKEGAHSISFQPFSSRQSGGNYLGFSFSYDDIFKIKKYILDAIETSHEYNLPIRSENMLRTIPEYILRNEELVMRKGCTIPLREALINRNGKLQLCFSMFGNRECYEKCNSKDFLSIWRKNSYKTLKKLAITGQCPGCLANCSDLKYWFNDEISIL